MIINSKQQETSQEKKSVIVHKYSNDRKGPLHESVILDGIPAFLKYENGKVSVVPHIEEPTRIIRPPRKEESPYIPYEFASLGEVQKFADEVRIKSIESFYLKAKDIVVKYVDQEESIIIMLAADIVWSYFQDLFPTTHYVNVTGENETGKSSIGFVYEFTGYRPVKASAISSANYYRTLGTIEPGQSTIIEDEADNIENDLVKIRILKHSYEYNARIPKVNMNAKDQNQNWFYGYSLKMIISEKPLDAVKAKGLVERTFTFHCKPAVKDNLQSIKKVSTNSPTDPCKQKLYQELMDFRKSMLCYRLTHYMEPIPDINIGLKNRDEELGGPLLQIFNGTKVFGDIKYALHIFLTERKANKDKTIKSALAPLIVDLIDKNRTRTLYAAQIWDELPNAIPGRVNPENCDEYQTNEYGNLYTNTLPGMIVKEFGALRDRKNDGTVLIFDQEKINELEMKYRMKVQEKDNVTMPTVNGEATKMEVVKDVDVKSDDSEGCDGSEGARVCGFIIEEI